MSKFFNDNFYKKALRYILTDNGFLKTLRNSQETMIINLENMKIIFEALLEKPVYEIPVLSYSLREEYIKKKKFVDEEVVKYILPIVIEKEVFTSCGCRDVFIETLLKASKLPSDLYYMYHEQLSKYTNIIFKNNKELKKDEGSLLLKTIDNSDVEVKINYVCHKMRYGTLPDPKKYPLSFIYEHRKYRPFSMINYFEKWGFQDDFETDMLWWGWAKDYSSSEFLRFLFSKFILFSDNERMNQKNAEMLQEAVQSDEVIYFARDNWKGPFSKKGASKEQREEYFFLFLKGIINEYEKHGFTFENCEYLKRYENKEDLLLFDYEGYKDFINKEMYCLDYEKLSELFFKY